MQSLSGLCNVAINETTLAAEWLEYMPAVLMKYRRMEEALQRIAESKVPDDETADEMTRRFIYAGDMLGMRIVARDALAFDPLSNKP